MAITVSVPLGAARETRQALFNFSVPDGCLVADSCFDCPLPDCKPVGLYAPASGIRPQQPKPPVPDDATILRRMADNGWTRDEAAQELGVSLRHMYRVTRRNKGNER